VVIGWRAGARSTAGGAGVGDGDGERGDDGPEGCTRPPLGDEFSAHEPERVGAAGDAEEVALVGAAGAGMPLRAGGPGTGGC
jgi:hypothetical protein